MKFLNILDHTSFMPQKEVKLCIRNNEKGGKLLWYGQNAIIHFIGLIEIGWLSHSCNTLNISVKKQDTTVLLSMLSSSCLPFWVICHFTVFCPIPDFYADLPALYAKFSRY